MVTKIYIFGSFARGALEPGDIDVGIELERDSRWSMHFVNSMSSGRNPLTIITKPLRGARRSLQFVFDPVQTIDAELTLVWERGDSLETAMARVNAIVPDPAAGRAPRDYMLPEFDGLDHWIPKPDRESIATAVLQGSISLRRIEIPDGLVQDPTAYWHIRHRWKTTSPLYRAAQAMLAYTEDRGINPLEVHLHGKDIESAHTPYFGGFQLRYLRAVPRCLSHHGGIEWIEIVHPTINKPLDALIIKPLDTDALDKTGW